MALTATNKWISSFSFWARTNWVSSVQFAESPVAAGRGYTRVRRLDHRGAADIGVTVEPRLAVADGVVVAGVADGVGPAELGAHGLTLALESVAVLILLAISVELAA